MIDILIVEDNEELANLLRDFLCMENYIVSIARTGEKALSLYEKYGARLIVLDIMLPETDGLSVCRKIREQSNTPIIIISAKPAKTIRLPVLTLVLTITLKSPMILIFSLPKSKAFSNGAILLMKSPTEN